MLTMVDQSPLAAEQSGRLLLCLTQLEHENAQLRAATPAYSELAHYTALLAQPPLPTWMAQEQRIVFVNAALCSWIGMAPEQLVGRPVADLFRAIQPIAIDPSPGQAAVDRREPNPVTGGICREGMQRDLGQMTWTCSVPGGQLLQVGVVGLALPRRAVEPRCASEAYLG